MNTNCIWERDWFTVDYKNNTYRFQRMNIDVSKSFEKPDETIYIDYRIEGLAMPVYMMTDLQEATFWFAHKVIEDGTDGGLFVNLQDTQTFETLAEMVNYVNETMG